MRVNRTLETSATKAENGRDGEEKVYSGTFGGLGG